MQRVSRVMTIAAILFGGAVFLTETRAYAQDTSPTIVEGHVFNKWTGVPLENSPIQIISENEMGVQNNFVVRTDENGFYSFSLDPEFALTRLWASCFSPSKGLSLNQISIPEPAVVIARRDVYLDVPAVRSFSRCRDVFFPTGR